MFSVRQDKFLLNALLESVTLEVAHLIVAAETLYEIWTKLANHFAKPSRSHILRLRQQLIKPQGAQPIATYLLDIRTATNELSLLNLPIRDDDLTLYIISSMALLRN